MFLNENALLIGHRGLSAFAPENTLPSFLKAAKEGLQWVEFDIRLTADMKLVVFHDDTLERTTNGEGLVSKRTLSELQLLDAGSWFSPAFQNTNISTLDEVLLFLEAHNLQANIEIKSTPEQADATVEAFFPYLQGWPRGKPYPFVSSFDHKALAHCRYSFPQLPIGYLVEKIKRKEIESLLDDPFCSINCSNEHNTLDDYQTLIQTDTPVFVYTVNKLDDAKKLFAAGVQGLFTDCLTPSLLRLPL
jgi:glycerophosphoryl diester phosphodiesterase